MNNISLFSSTDDMSLSLSHSLSFFSVAPRAPRVQSEPRVREREERGRSARETKRVTRRERFFLFPGSAFIYPLLPCCCSSSRCPQRECVCVRVSAGDVIKFPGNLVLPCAPLEPVCARVTRNNARERARGGGEAREESLRLGSKAVRDTASREGRQRQQEQTARGVASQRLSQRERKQTGGREQECRA